MSFVLGLLIGAILKEPLVMLYKKVTKDVEKMTKD